MMVLYYPRTSLNNLSTVSYFGKMINQLISNIVYFYYPKHTFYDFITEPLLLDDPMVSLFAYTLGLTRLMDHLYGSKMDGRREVFMLMYLYMTITFIGYMLYYDLGLVNLVYSIYLLLRINNDWYNLEYKCRTYDIPLRLITFGIYVYTSKIIWNLYPVLSLMLYLGTGIKNI